MFKACALDFDGVILESVQVKLAAFKQLFATEDPKGAIAGYLEAHNGVDRYTKFRYIWEKILSRRYGSEVEDELDRRFNELVLSGVLSCPFVPGAESFVRSGALPLYVVSAMPLRDLKVIVEKRGIAGCFRGLYGAPGRKSDRLKEILDIEGIDPKDLLFVGDSREDYVASREAGVRFIGRKNAEPLEDLGVTLMPDLFGLAERISASPL